MNFARNPVNISQDIAQFARALVVGQLGQQGRNCRHQRLQQPHAIQRAAQGQVLSPLIVATFEQDVGCR